MHGSLYVCAGVYRCICMEVYMYVRVFIGVVTYSGRNSTLQVTRRGAAKESAAL